MVLSPIALTWNGAKDGGASVPVNAWVISEYPSDRAGHRIALAGRCLRGDPNCVFKPPTWVHTVYQPASRFWELQAIETALFGGLAAVLILVAAWWVRERVA